MTINTLLEDQAPASPSNSGKANQTRVDMSIVLVCWNNKDYLDPCLQSLYEAGLTSSFDVIVVDNGSTDGSMDMVREKYSDVMIIENETNMGLSRASNQGIEATRGDFVLLLNNDTLVNAKALDAMVDFLKSHPEAGAAGGKLLNGDGTFQSGYALFSNLWEEFLNVTTLGYILWKGYPSHYDSDTVKKVGWLSSACLLIRRTALEKSGLLDESYFIYGDEVDLQYRLYKVGQPVYYIPGIQTTHFGGKSMNRWPRRKRVYRGKLLFYMKNYSWFSTFILRIMIFIATIFKLIIWGSFFLIFAKHRDYIKKALASNIEVIKLCFKTE